MATKPKTFTHQFPAWPEHIADDDWFWPTNKFGAPIIPITVKGGGFRSTKERASHTENGVVFSQAEFLQLFLVDQGVANHVAFAPQVAHNIAILDIDTAKIDPKNPDKAKIEKHHAELLEAFEDTYIEVSRSGNGHHIVFLLPDGHGLDPKRVNSQAHVELFVSTGYVLLTGNCVTTKRLATITGKELATLRRLFPEYDTEASGAPAEGAEEMSYDELISRMKNTGPRWVRLLTGEGDGELSTDLSNDRAALIQWAATITTGVRGQADLVWQMLSRSWFAQVHTPQASIANGDRFTDKRKRRYMKNTEIPKWIKRTASEVAAQREEAEQARIAFEANRPENIAQTAVVKGENVDQAPTGTPAPPLPSNRSQMGGSNENASLPSPPKTTADVPPPPPAPQSDPKTEVDLTTFPVPILQDMHAYIRTSVFETEETLAHAATLGAASALIARYFASPTGLFSNIYLVCLGDSGIGKEVLRKGFTQLTDHLSHYMENDYHQHLAGMHGTPQSGIALHKRVVDRPNDALIMTEFGDDVAKWINQGPATRYILTFLKDQYGQSQSGSHLSGAAYSAHDNSVDAIQDPALTLIGGGVPQPWFETMRSYGLTDGFAGRLLFVEAGKEYIDDSQSSAPPEALIQRLKKALTFMLNRAYPELVQLKIRGGTAIPPKVGKIPNRTVPLLSTDAASILKAYQMKIREEYRRNDDRNDDQKALARSLHENAQRIALTLAAWDYIDHRNEKRGLVIDERHAAWGVAYVKRSHELVEKHLKTGAYDHGELAAAVEVATKVARLAENPNAKAKTKSDAEAMRERQEFTLGGLQTLKQVVTKFKTPQGPSEVKGKQVAVEVLMQRGAIERVENSRFRFRLGQHFISFCGECGIEYLGHNALTPRNTMKMIHDDKS